MSHSRPVTARPERASASSIASARVQTLRGLACLLLVAYHVIGSDSTMGMRVADGTFYRMFLNSMNLLRMPLFTCLAGFVYAYRPLRAGARWVFARKKLLRLAIPLFTVETLFFLTQIFVPGVNVRPNWASWWRIYVLPYQHFWFLQAILLIFAAIAFLEQAGILRDVRSYVLILIGALLLHFFVQVQPNIFSVDQACYLLPFFLLGLGVNRFAALFDSTLLLAASLASFLVTMTIHVLGAAGMYGSMLQPQTALATLLSLSGLLLLLRLMPVQPQLTWIGGFSFTIYLYHVFFTAGARIGLEGLGVTWQPINFVVGCAVGTAGPISVELLLRRNQAMRRLFLGQS
jgi:peptidoglycan/LPS O-acetylase OafA/YrhL